MPRLTRMSTATANLMNVENNRPQTLRSASLRNLKSSAATNANNKIVDDVKSNQILAFENRNPLPGGQQYGGGGGNKRSKRDSKDLTESQTGQPAPKRRSGLGDVTNTFKLQPLAKPNLPNKIPQTRSSTENAQAQAVIALSNVRVVSTISTRARTESRRSFVAGGQPPRIPPGVIDYDKVNADDPYQEPNYAMHIFQYYKSREATFAVPDYLQLMSDAASNVRLPNPVLSRQPEITESMRAILVDWLVEVQESFEMNHETLYTAVRLVDLYLAHRPTPILKANLQLIGITAFLIAAKVDERIPPLVDDFVYVCDDAYSREDVLATEIEMFSIVGFDVGYPLSYRFLRRYARVCQVSTQTLTFGRYVLEMSLMEYHLNVSISESRLAAAVLILVLEIQAAATTLSDGKQQTTRPWEATLKYYSGYAIADCYDLIGHLHAMLLKQQKAGSAASVNCRRTIRSKYSHEVFHSVAQIVVPERLAILELKMRTATK